MNQLSDDELEIALSRIEFPGEDPGRIIEYLRDHSFSDRIMENVRAETERSRRAVAWALFAAINLVLLILVGTNRHLFSSYFAFQDTLTQLFFLFFGISFLGGLFGLIVLLDTSWIENVPDHVQPLLTPLRQIVRYVHRR